MKIKKSRTGRGFAVINFADSYNHECSIQKSSLATDDAIWIGLDKAKPEVMASQAASVGVLTDKTCGWVKYPIPDEVSLWTRMHLTRAQVKKLIPILQHFVDTGELPVK